MFRFIKKIIWNKFTKFLFWFFVISFLIGSGLLAIWISNLTLPNLDNFNERRVAQATKIYDRTGEILLFDIYGDFKRTVVPLSEISEYVQKATIATEDKDFYNHNGIQVSAILRAVINNIKSGDLLGGQGGSTITQQIIKNALLTTDKKVSRKIKEWVLAPRLENKLSKDEILELYLNEVPYGGTIYGVEEASLGFFGKNAKDLNLLESAYIAALPQAPTFYSPYGNNRDELEKRKNFVLEQMHLVGYITKEEMDITKEQTINFQRQEKFNIKAPHFVMYVREQLEEEFGKSVIEEGGLKVITTLDWEMQQKADEVVKKYVFGDDKLKGIAERFDANNAALVVVDPNNGEILTMVGSRDYFDKEIDGNFNITTSNRQPGSAFKPFAYAQAFEIGYKPETVVFDVQTQFDDSCGIRGGQCYMPRNFDGNFRGPMSLRSSLARSMNIPAVKVLYLSGIRNVINLTKKMGITTLNDPKGNIFGLSLVLGGGEVKPVEMASAYGVFATEGLKYNKSSILKIEDSSGEIIYEREKQNPERVLSENTSRIISDILSDNSARAPTFGLNSTLHFANTDVAVKTGTTNDYRDAWVVGYTPKISVAAWAGNNDNSPMTNTLSSLVITPLWREFMFYLIEKGYTGDFTDYEDTNLDVKPIINGFWRGEKTEVLEDDNGNKQIVVKGGGEGIHSILHWVNKNDPLGPIPENPSNDPQYILWEQAVRNWVTAQNISEEVNVTDITELKKVGIEIINPIDGDFYFGEYPLVVVIRLNGGIELQSGNVYINKQKIGEIDKSTMSYTVIPDDEPVIVSDNELKVEVRDIRGNSYEDKIRFKVR